MKWSEVCIHTTNEAVEPISNLLHETGVGGVVIEDALDLMKSRDSLYGEIYELNPHDFPQEGVYIKVYLSSDSFLKEKVEKIKKGIDHLQTFGVDLGKNEIYLKEIKEIDWETAWKKHYKPVKISNKITIVPSWEDYKATAEELIIELDPGMAFGTGTHPTTMLCIQALERHIAEDDMVIDVGCGSGVLSITSCLLGAKEVYAFDLDNVAVKSTEVNASLNKMNKEIIARQNNLLDHVDLKVDIIVSNILAEVIIQFIKEAWNNLKQNGLFITSGIIAKKKELVINGLQTNGFHIIEIEEQKGWLCIIAQKMA